MTTTPGELDIRRTLDVTRADYKDFDEDLVRLVQSSIMPPDASNADTYFLLQLAARYKLDPFAREIWAVPTRGKNGERKGTLILVGRDGLLAVAERHRTFRGFRNLPVYENDEFSYEAEPREMPDGTFSHVRHSFKVTEDRGKLLGAWAEAYRKDRPAVFFYAPLEQYFPKSEKKAEYSPWSTTLDVMIAKCALATSLRLAFRISGLYLEEEMEQARRHEPDRGGEYVGPDYGDDPVVEARLRQLFAAAEEAQPGSWLPGKVNVTLSQLESHEDRVALMAYLEQFILDRGGEVPLADVIESELAVDQESTVLAERADVAESTDDQERSVDDDPGEGGQARLV